MLYDVNNGTRDYFTYTEAMLNNSLFSFFLQKNGLKVHKQESTRDVICLDFDFGSRSYETEIKRLNKMMAACETDDDRQRIQYIIDKVNNNKDLYKEISRDELRELYYENGVDITYHKKDKDGNILSSETIHYQMLFRTSAKAKIGQVMFINSKLYNKAYNWLTMGLGKKLPLENAKIVEMSAYAPLTTSTIVGTLEVPVEDVLILEDQNSFFKTMANIVKAESYTNRRGETTKKCVVSTEETQVKNTIWDGMMLIETSILPDWVNGMALLRNHFFKACGFKANIQLFFKDYCLKNGIDYNTFVIKDMFGNEHFAKDIKMITTDNAIKWKKFSNLMGKTLADAYDYWCKIVRKDGNIWGIVKTDHTSKLGEHQQLSYQMVNTLPCTKEDVQDIAQTSIDYVESLKNDNDVFVKFLRKNANAINHYNMLADLYEHNKNFANSKYFRDEKKDIVFQFVYKLRKGKIFVDGDNLTVCGNPYALLLHSVGEDFTTDPTLVKEDGCVQCYTTRFEDDEYLAAFRNPHNSPNNICYLHNKYSNEMSKYFPFSKNIIAINCIETDIQDRANGMDEDLITGSVL